MLTFFAVTFGAWFVYAVTVYWLVFWRGPWRTAYHPLIAWLLRRLGQQAITIGARTYLSLPDAVLSEMGERHERFHVMQQRRHPLLFFPRYLFLLARYGYAKHPDEQDARADAGEPRR